MNKECFFCNETAARTGIFFENAFFVARWDDFPVSKGHALIISKRHILSFFDMEQAEVAAFYEAICETKELVKGLYAPDGYNIGINDGEAAGRTVHHLHIHVIPRYAGDVANPRGGVRHIIPGKGSY